VAAVEERSRRRGDELPVDRERCPSSEHEIQLLVAPGALTELVVLADDLLARLRRAPRVDSERLDPEHRANHVPARLAFVRVPVDFVEPQNAESLGRRL